MVVVVLIVVIIVVVIIIAMVIVVEVLVLVFVVLVVIAVVVVVVGWLLWGGAHHGGSGSGGGFHASILDWPPFHSMYRDLLQNTLKISKVTLSSTSSLSELVSSCIAVAVSMMRQCHDARDI